jgi:hypothetical protein
MKRGLTNAAGAHLVSGHPPKVAAPPPDWNEKR